MKKRFRIPLAGSITKRVSSTSILNSVSGFVGLGVIGVMVIGKTTASSAKDQNFINCFSETIVDAVTGKKRVFAVKRPGWASSITTATADIGTALFIWTGLTSGDHVISAFGGTNSTIYKNTSSLGAITGKATGITETFISGVATLAITSSDSTGWYYDVPTGAATKITDADFPGNASKTLAGTFAHLDGFAVVMTTDGILWASDLNSITSWTATSYGSTNDYQDKGVGCVRHRNLIMAFGSESIEFWQNAGLSPFPLSRVSSMTQRVGCISADAIAQLSGITFWAGTSPQGGITIYQFDSDISRISTPEVDEVMILAGTANISLTTLRFYGRAFVLVKCANVTLAYCMEEKTWSEWTGPWYKMVGLSIGSTLVNYAISKSLTTGAVYSMNHSAHVFKDAGELYTVRMQLDGLDFGTTDYKAWHELNLVCDKQDSESLITVSYSDDDYNNFTIAGTMNMAENIPALRRLGKSRRRALAFNHSSDAPMRIEAIEIVASYG